MQIIRYTKEDVKKLISNSTQKYLETLYINAKINYYEGCPIMDDSSFDLLEEHLKKLKSSIIKQVGSKRKDFNVPHPSIMLSLSKLQMEKIDGETNYKEFEFYKWASKRATQCGVDANKIKYQYSPKFDGNAINIVYEGGKLSYILTRGDGKKGKNVTDRLKDKVPDNIKSISLTEDSILEVRCEVVIKKSIFNKINEERKKEELDLFANPRNYVAGLLGSDDEDKNVKYLEVKALAFILNGKHLNPLLFDKEFNTNSYIKEKTLDDYKNYIKQIENEREDYPYQIDGIVISFLDKYRHILGENDHDPEWAIAIKLLPEEVHAEIENIEWNVGKTGELIPVLLITPIELAGTIVKRISGYNAGYVITNKLGKGAIINIHKAGDIIPEVQSVVKQGSLPILPQTCPICGEKTSFEENIHLMCNNNSCPGKMKKRLMTSIKTLEIKGIGPAIIERFSEDFTNMIDLLCWVKEKGNTKEIESYGFKLGSRSHELFLKSFNKIEELSYAQVILLLGYDNVGIKLCEQVAKDHCGMMPNYSGHDRSLVSLLNKEETKCIITDAINRLKGIGINITSPKEEKATEDSIFVVMTGSPKPTWKTKEEFIAKFSGKLVDVDSLSDERCMYLITDSYGSTSSKMKIAKKKNIKIITYEDFFKKQKEKLIDVHNIND